MKQTRISQCFGIIIAFIFILFDLSFALNTPIQATSPAFSPTKASNTSPPIAKPIPSLINGTFIDNNKETKGTKFLISQNKKFLADSSDNQNKIDIWENSNGEVTIRLKLKEKDQRIKITIWNMLGKAVIEDFEGNYKDLETEHVIRNSNALNRGAYLIRIQGEKSKMDAKFIKSR